MQWKHIQDLTIKVSNRLHKYIKSTKKKKESSLKCFLGVRVGEDREKQEKKAN